MDCLSETEEEAHGSVDCETQLVGKKHTNLTEFKINAPQISVAGIAKEEKLEKQDSESYSVMENVLREIEKSLGDENINCNEINSAARSIPCPPQASTSTNPTDPPVIFKRKRGRPRKGSFVPKTAPQQTPILNNDHSSASILFEKPNKINRASFLSYDSTEDPWDGETDSETKPKRKRRSKILDDFVADFNTSDEEDDGFLSFPKFPSRGRGRGRGRRTELSDPFDDDLFSSYIGVFGKKFSIEDDFPSDSLLGEINESDDDMVSPSNITTVKVASASVEDGIVKDELEGVLGPEGNTKVQIVNTGQTEVVDNEECLLYNVVINTGSTNNVVPLRIPKVAKDSQSEAEITNQPSTSHSRQDQNTGSYKPKLASPLRKKQKQISQQVSSLRQRYYRALQELRKRPRVYTLADLVYGASSFLSEDQLIFFTLQLKSGCNKMQGIRFSVREKILALAFYLQSPSLYKWLRSVFHLPSKLILERWLEGIAKTDPDAAKRLMYHVYTRYIFKS